MGETTLKTLADDMQCAVQVDPDQPPWGGQSVDGYRTVQDGPFSRRLLSGSGVVRSGPRSGAEDAWCAGASGDS